MTDAERPRVRPGALLLRATWVVVRVLLVICLGQAGVRFFYQGF